MNSPIRKNVRIKGVLQRLARVHALRGAPSLSSLDALVDGRHVSVASDLVGEFDQAGAPLHLGHGQQGGDGAHGRAPQLLLLLELLLHRTGLHLCEGGGEVTSASSRAHSPRLHGVLFLIHAIVSFYGRHSVQRSPRSDRFYRTGHLKQKNENYIFLLLFL